MPKRSVDADVDGGGKGKKKANVQSGDADAEGVKGKKKPSVHHDSADQEVVSARKRKWDDEEVTEAKAPKGKAAATKGNGQKDREGGHKKQRDSLDHVKQKPVEKPADTKKLVFPVLVRGLGEVSMADVDDLFAACGKLQSSRITGHGKAIITFTERAAAAAAHKLNGTAFEERTIRVSLLKPVPEREAGGSAAAPHGKKDDEDDEVSFSVIVNNVPPGTNQDELQVFCKLNC